jgi:threonine dehydrogenase-like Zn-dependent dehydrogenase
VTEIGAGVSRLKVGDRVVMPFNVGCGPSRHCGGLRPPYKRRDPEHLRFYEAMRLTHRASQLTGYHTVALPFLP